MKIIGTYFLSRVSGIGLLGAAISTLLCYFTIMCLNLYFMISKTGFRVKVTSVVVKPLISGILCGLSAVLTSFALGFTPFYGRIGTIIAIGVAAVVYFAVLVALKGLNRYDVLMMPKGQKLCALLDKFNLLEKGE